MSTTQSQARKTAKGVKARRMWAASEPAKTDACALLWLSKVGSYRNPVLVIPASPSGVAALREKINAELHAFLGGTNSPLETTDRILAALGLPAAASLRATAKRKGGAK